MDEFTVECCDLTRTFGNRTAIGEVCFRIRRGGILGLVGSNGAGKTTLIKILATLLLPSAGTARICGEDVIRSPARVREKIGFVASEERSFYWRLTGRQNLEFFAALHDIPSGERIARIDSLLEAVGLQESAGRQFREYSTGMRQALGIARGLLHDPQVLLLDEPTRSLSPDVAERIRELVRCRAKQEGKTVLFASHNLTEVGKIADEIAILHRGALRAVGTIPELTAASELPDNAGLEHLFLHYTRQDERA